MVHTRKNDLLWLIASQQGEADKQATGILFCVSVCPHVFMITFVELFNIAK